MTAVGLRPGHVLAALMVTTLWAAATACSASPPPLPRRDAPATDPSARPSAPAASSAPLLPPPPTPVVKPRSADQAKLQLPELAVQQLPSGLAIAVVTLPDAPLGTIELEVAAGGLADRPGVAELTAGLVAQGAASSRVRAGELTRAVAALGANLAVEVDGGHTRFRLTVPGDQLAPAVAVLGDMVHSRGLRATSYRSLRARALSAARSRAGDDAGWLTREVLQRSLLGGGQVTSRRATRGTYSELSRVRHAHCNEFYATHYRGERTRLRVVGSQPLATVVAAAEKAFGRYPAAKKTDPVAPLGPPPEVKGRPIYLVDHPKAPRSTVATGWVTPLVTPATLPALRILVPALTAALRSPPATAKGPPAGMAPPEAVLLPLSEARYLVVVTTTVPGAATARAAAHLTATLTTFAQTPIPPERVAALARQQTTALAAGVDDPLALLQWTGEQNVVGATADDWLALPARLATITPATVDQLRSALRPPAVLVAVGDAEQLGPQLTGLGETKVINGRAGFGTVKTLRPAQR